MEYEEALHIFVLQLKEQYGVEEGVVKIALVPELYDRVMHDVAIRNRFTSWCDSNNPKIRNVFLAPKIKEDF